MSDTPNAGPAEWRFGPLPVLRPPCYALVDEATRKPFLLRQPGTGWKLLVLFSDADSAVAFSTRVGTSAPTHFQPLRERDELNLYLEVGHLLGAEGVILNPDSSDESRVRGSLMSAVQVRRCFHDEPPI